MPGSARGTPAFRRVGRFHKGYDVRQVDAFVRREVAARRLAAVGRAGSAASAGGVRVVAFPLRRHGYDVVEVDRALDRLEDGVAAREKASLLTTGGPDALLAHLEGQAATLDGRLSRPAGRRFRRERLLRLGYHRADVDALCDQIASYLADGEPMSPDDVRLAVFRRRRGRRGYREADVDAFLDRAVSIMLAVD